MTALESVLDANADASTRETIRAACATAQARRLAAPLGQMYVVGIVGAAVPAAFALSLMAFLADYNAEVARSRTIDVPSDQPIYVKVRVKENGRMIIDERLVSSDLPQTMNRYERIVVGSWAYPNSYVCGTPAGKHKSDDGSQVRTVINKGYARRVKIVANQGARQMIAEFEVPCAARGS